MKLTSGKGSGSSKVMPGGIRRFCVWSFYLISSGAHGSSPLGKNLVFASENFGTGVQELELGYARSMPADLESTPLSVWQQS